MNQEDKIIKNKLGVLRLADMLGNVSQACNAPVAAAWCMFDSLVNTRGKTSQITGPPHAWAAASCGAVGEPGDPDVLGYIIVPFNFK